jgi:hypothetical protein
VLLIHPFKFAFTLIIPIIGAVVELIAVKEGIFPEPPAAKPIAVFEFVQEYKELAGVLEKTIGTVAVFAHKVRLLTAFKTGFGLTVIVKLAALLVQPFTVAVALIEATLGTEDELVAVKEGIFPVPLAANPIVEFEFTQL